MAPRLIYEPPGQTPHRPDAVQRRGYISSEVGVTPGGRNDHESEQSVHPPLGHHPVILPTQLPTQHAAGPLISSSSDQSYDNDTANRTQSAFEDHHRSSSSGRTIVPTFNSRRTGGVTARDPETDASTVWEFYPAVPSQFSDATTGSQRALYLRRIRESAGDRHSRQVLTTRSPQRDLDKFAVIEALIVPPLRTESSIITYVTSESIYAGRSKLRKKKFVIIERPPRGHTFRALGIKTHNGQGVALNGVIKSHHAIIHSSRTAPAPNPLELPRRLPNGQIETGMQPTAIRVDPDDPATALDSMARLDFGDIYEFELSVPNINRFGRVHKNSEAALMLQFDNVWRIASSAERRTSNPPAAPGAPDRPFHASGPEMRTMMETVHISDRPGPSQHARSPGSRTAQSVLPTLGPAHSVQVESRVTQNIYQASTSGTGRATRSIYPANTLVAGYSWPAGALATQNTYQTNTSGTRQTARNINLVNAPGTGYPGPAGASTAQTAQRANALGAGNSGPAALPPVYPPTSPSPDTVAGFQVPLNAQPGSGRISELETLTLLRVYRDFADQENLTRPTADGPAIRRLASNPRERVANFMRLVDRWRRELYDREQDESSEESDSSDDSSSED